MPRNFYLWFMLLFAVVLPATPGFLALFVLVWCGITALLSRLSGWRGLPAFAGGRRR